MSNNSVVSSRNLLDIIKVIHNKGPVSKTETARLLNLTTITIQNYFNRLIEGNIIIEDGNAQSNGGRKAILYRINPEFGYIISQNIGNSYIDTSIYDMSMTLLYSNRLSCRMEYTEKLMHTIHREIETGMEKLKLSAKKCLGIGISIPGQVDHERGVVLNITHVPGWRNIPLKSIIEERTGIVTYVDNDNNLIALAAKWLNIVKDNTDVVFLSITSGIGSGILIKGKLLYGSLMNVGEIGHTTIWLDGPECNCGNKGCIEVLASDLAIIRKVKECKKADPLYNGVNIDEIDIYTVVNMAKAGDREVNDILMKTAEYISIAIDHLIKLYGSGVIIIGSNWLKYLNHIFAQIIDMVFSRCNWTKREDLEIILNKIDNIENIAPATLVFERLFEHLDDNPFIKNRNTEI